MEQVRKINGTVELHAKQNVHRIPISKIYKEEMSDIKLNFNVFPIWTQRTIKLTLNEANKINFYLNYRDKELKSKYVLITHKILEEIINSVESNFELYSKELINCLEGLKNKQENNGYDGDYINIELVEKFQQELSDKPEFILNFLKADISAEDSEKVIGNDTPYHLLNFFGWGMSIPEISLKRICNELEIDLNDIINFNISAGKDPYYDLDFNGYGSGGVYYDLTISNNNNLEDFIITILDLLDDIDENVQELISKRETLILDLNKLSIESKNLDSELKSVNQRIGQILTKK